MNDHQRQHFTASDTVRDAILGMSDGLTVPFALAAGLTGAVAASHLVVTAGLAEVVAGAISMGLGGYLATRSEVEHYIRERAVEEREVSGHPERVEAELVAILDGYGLSADDQAPIIKSLRHDPKAWVDFMMSNELKLEETTEQQARRSALTIGGAYAIGGIIPLIPYFLTGQAHRGLAWSVAVTGCALLTFGYVKARIGGTNPFRSAIQTVIVGGLAATAAYLLAFAINR